VSVGRVSVILTVLNERESIRELLEALITQTRRPDEVVVADAGSTDGTRELISEMVESHPEIRLIAKPGNRSVGRNAAIAAATGDVIAATDGGCVPDPDWLEHLIEPVEAGAGFVAGFYRPVGPTLRSTCIGLAMVPVLDEVVPGDFLPSARSVAFLKRVWSQVGGFPTDTEYAEDTLFDQRVIDAGHWPVFAPEATVSWRPPSDYWELARTSFRWGRGDGLVGLRGALYRRLLARYVAPALATVALGVWRPRWAPIAALPLAAQTVHSTRRKYRWVAGWTRFIHLPRAHLTAVFSSLAGYVTGLALSRSGSGSTQQPGSF